MTERAISCLKSDAKRRLTDPQVQALLGDRVAASTAGLTLHRHRMKILRGKVEDALPSITPFKCHQWHSHSLTYTEKCLNKDDIFIELFSLSLSLSLSLSVCVCVCVLL